MNDVPKRDNQTSLPHFLLYEFSKNRELQIMHFSLFMALYLVTVTGNLLIVFAIALDPHLHSPMYLFLLVLAIQDLGSVSVIIPKSMSNSLWKTRHISYSGCVFQVLFLIFFLGSDVALLTIMAYDRHVAICNPLQYEMVMNRTACTQMVVGAWLAAFFNAALHTGGTFLTPFCSNVVNQFFCEAPWLLKLACSEYNQQEIGVNLLTATIATGCFIFIIVSYIQIFLVVLKIPSLEGRKKAFSTCLPHLLVFSTFFLTCCLAYLRRTSSVLSHLDLAFTLLYSTLPPMLNPLIYSMRNKSIKVALSRLFILKLFSKKDACICHILV